LPNQATPGRARLSPKAREVVGLVALVHPSSLHASCVNRSRERVREGALPLLLEPVPNVSAGKGDSPSRPTTFFLDKGQRLVSFSPVSP